MFDVKVLGPEHPDYTHLMKRAFSGGLNHADNTLYLYQPKWIREKDEPDSVDIIDPETKRETTIPFLLWNINLFSHETLHHILTHLISVKASKQLDRITKYVPNEFIYAGF